MNNPSAIRILALSLLITLIGSCGSKTGVEGAGSRALFSGLGIPLQA